MSLSTIIRKIESEAEAAGQKILAQANAEAERLLEQARIDAEREAADLLRRADDDLRRFTQKQMASAHLQARNQHAEHRQNLLKTVHDRALERVLACDDAQFTAIMTTMLLSVAEERAADILPADADAALFSEHMLTDINATLKTRQRALSYTCSSQTAAISRGCILDFQDFEMNYALDTILAGLWEQMKPDVAARLFDDGTN